MSDNITLTKGHLEEAMDLVKGDRIQIFVLKQARLIVQTGGGAGARGLNPIDANAYFTKSGTINGQNLNGHTWKIKK